MTDLRVLTEAFAELERRADATTAATRFELARRRAPRPGSRLVPVAATAVIVAGVAAGVVLLVPGGDGGTPATSPPTASESASAPASTAPAFTVPSTPEELADRFRAVLGDTATFTVTEGGPGAAVATMPPPPSTPPPGEGRTPVPDGTTSVGASISGTLTASGLTGGFHLVVTPHFPARDVLWCGEENPDPARCAVHERADGSTLVVRRETLEGSPNGVDHSVRLIRSDGVDFDLHVSNQRSPKGASEELAPHPPLTTDQMIAILSSDRW